MKVLAWRPPGSTRIGLNPVLVRGLGTYAGLARYQPRGYAWLNPTLSRAVGKLVALRFERIASIDEPFAGQALYSEEGSGAVLDDWLIPEQDLHFVD